MARKLTKEEEFFYSKQLKSLYSEKNLSLTEISLTFKIPKSTLYDRLIRFGIKIKKESKSGYLNKRKNFIIPKTRSLKLAEFFGIMLGDGCLNKYQVMVTLGNKENSYAEYVNNLLKDLFKINPTIRIRKTGYLDVYFGSKNVVDWLLAEGLVFNKTKSQVRIPIWITRKKSYMKSFVRGFFDTDGSVYKIRHGIQISFTNKSKPLLVSLHNILKKLEYKTSEISGDSIYITSKDNVNHFFKEINPKNSKHKTRYITLRQ